MRKPEDYTWAVNSQWTLHPNVLIKTNSGIKADFKTSAGTSGKYSSTDFYKS